MIQNRETFLAKIASQLGKAEPSKIKPDRNWRYLPQHEILKDASSDELIDILIEQCKVIHTTIYQTNRSALSETLQKVIPDNTDRPILYSKDSRWTELGLNHYFKEVNAINWDYTKAHSNIELAEQAAFGLVVSDLTLAESGTIMIQANPNVGRTLSFLPENSIAIIPKSTIVPRMTQAAQFLRRQSHVSSCINFITGPSNSADIEMNLVVGVHGPVKMTYLIVEDY